MVDGDNQLWTLESGEIPILATAIHNGHELRGEVRQLIKIDEATRRREEDPFTANFTHVSDNRVILHRSRFEFDLNRSREKSVYVRPEDAWGLEIWKSKPPEEVVKRSLAEYDKFYEMLRAHLKRLIDKFGCLVVYDLHSYNHRRAGKEAPPDDPKANPEINVGTGTLNRDRWGQVVERFMSDLRKAKFHGKALDVRENVKFKGANLAAWIHENFADSVCVLAIEFKKMFMDEWTGICNSEDLETFTQALRSTVPGTIESMGIVKKSVKK